MWLSDAQNAQSLCLILILLASARTSECSVLGRELPSVESNSTSLASSSRSHSSSTHHSTAFDLSSSASKKTNENSLSRTHSSTTLDASSDVTENSNSYLISSTHSSIATSHSSSATKKGNEDPLSRTQSSTTLGVSSDVTKHPNGYPFLSTHSSTAISRTSSATEKDARHSSSTSSIRRSPTVTPTTPVTSSSFHTRTTSNGNHDTITAPPSSSGYPWGDQIIPLNTCSFVAPGGNIEYEPCVVSAGEIKLSFFPEANGNTTYPSTYWAADWDVMMTSPLIYMMINTITGTNNCGPLGPTYTNKVISMNITDVSTLPPYADATAQERFGGQEVPLTLSDLLHCPPRASFVPMSVQTDPHPLLNDYNRCNPHLVYPEQASAIGYPYWVHCGAHNYRVGIFDPPGAVPSVNALLPTTAAAPYTSSYEAPSAIPVITVQPVTTSPIAVAPEVTRPPVVSVSPVVPAATVLNSVPTPAAETPATQENAISTPAKVISSQPDPPATVIAVIGTHTISAAPSSAGIVLPNGSTAGIGAVVTLINTNGNSITISVSSSGIVVAGDSRTTFYANPVPTTSLAPLTVPKAIATLRDGQVISAAPGASILEINGQNITEGGAELTLAGSNDVATLDPSQGLIIHFASGTVATYAVPTTTTPSSEITATGPTVIATVNGYAITATPGASTIVIGTQTVSVGGPVVTLAGSNNVATLDVSSLIIQYPSGTVSTYALPSAEAKDAAPAPAETMSLATSNPDYGTPVVVIGSQTVALGGPAVTLSNDDVVTLGPIGLGIQMPGGGVSTMTLPVIAAASASPTPSGQKIANIIASIAGIPPPSGETGVSSVVASLAGIGETIPAVTNTAETAAESTSTRVLISGAGSSSVVSAGTVSSTYGNGTSSASQTLILQTALSGGSRVTIRDVTLWSLPFLIPGVIYGM